MSTKLTKYIEAGYSLSPEERQEAARMLRLSVDQDPDLVPSHVEASWRHEVGSRVDGIFAGEVELVEAEETYRLLSVELASKRK